MTGLLWGAVAGLGLLLLITPADNVWSSSTRRRLRIQWPDLAFALLSGMITWILEVPTLSIISAVAVLVGLQQKRAVAAQRTFIQRSNAWPDAIDFLISSIRAGMPIGSALIALQEEGPEILRPLLLPARQALVNNGTVADALRLIRAKSEDPIADRLCLILEISHSAGGTALGEVLRSLANYVRAESRTRSELISRQAWTINAAKLAVVAPWVIVVLLSIKAHEAYATATGSTLLLLGSLATSLGYGWMRRAARLPLVPRLS